MTNNLYVKVIAWEIVKCEPIKDLYKLDGCSRYYWRLILDTTEILDGSKNGHDVKRLMQLKDEGWLLVRYWGHTADASYSKSASTVEECKKQLCEYLIGEAPMKSEVVEKQTTISSLFNEDT